MEVGPRLFNIAMRAARGSASCSLSKGDDVAESAPSFRSFVGVYIVPTLMVLIELALLFFDGASQPMSASGSGRAELLFLFAAIRSRINVATSFFGPSVVDRFTSFSSS